MSYDATVCHLKNEFGNFRNPTTLWQPAWEFLKGEYVGDLHGDGGFFKELPFLSIIPIQSVYVPTCPFKTHVSHGLNSWYSLNIPCSNPLYNSPQGSLDHSSHHLQKSRNEDCPQVRPCNLLKARHLTDSDVEFSG